MDRLREWIDGAPAPAVAVSVESPTGTIFRHIAGTADVTTGEPVTAEHRWDLASLTKCLVTSVAVLDLVDDGVLALDTPLGEVLPPASRSRWAPTTIAALLSHATGLPGDRRLYLEGHADREAVVAAALATEPVSDGPVYSDLNYVFLGEAVAAASGGRTLAEFAQARGFAGYPARDEPGPFVATEQCPWRGRLLRGEVHDENAAALGGVAGHAGAFATLAAAAAGARAWLTGEGLPESSRAAARRWAANGQEEFGLGFFLGRTRGLGGAHPGSGAFGASGFVGNRLWVEPARGYAVVVLANRVHLHRGAREPYDRWSARAMDLVAESIDASR